MLKRILMMLLMLLPATVFAVCNPFTANTKLTASALNNAISAPCITSGSIDGVGIGLVTPATGIFSSLSASSSISGAGFSSYLASPPAIGGSVPATGSFTQITSTAGDVNLKTNTNLNTSATITAAQLLNGEITSAPTAAITLTTGTAANILAEARFASAVVGSNFDVVFVNNKAFDVTLGLGVGVTNPSLSRLVINNGSMLLRFTKTGAGAVEVKRLEGSTGRVLQIANFQTGALATGTTIIPLDNTIPQITEGDQYMSLVFTPLSATSRLSIEVVCNLGFSIADAVMSTALFMDAVPNSLAAAASRGGVNNQTYNIKFNHNMLSGTTSAITFRIRAGGFISGTTTFNGTGGLPQLGGVMASSITIMEYIP